MYVWVHGYQCDECTAWRILKSIRTTRSEIYVSAPWLLLTVHSAPQPLPSGSSVAIPLHNMFVQHQTMPFH